MLQKDIISEICFDEDAGGEGTPTAPIIKSGRKVLLSQLLSLDLLIVIKDSVFTSTLHVRCE